MYFEQTGVNSTVRFWLQQGQQSSHTHEYATWSYKQFLIARDWAKQLDSYKRYHIYLE